VLEVLLLFYKQTNKLKQQTIWVQASLASMLLKLN